MLHDRIAITLRDHFSTVGPSPTSSPHPLSLGAQAPRERQQLSPSRLTLLPRVASHPTTSDTPAQPAVASVSTDVIAATAHRCASFFAEAAVLVLVLGILDRFLAANRIGPRWIAGSFLLALGLLAASVATDVTARRWLRAH